MNLTYLILWVMLMGVFGEQYRYDNMTHNQLTTKSRQKRMENIGVLTLKVKINRKSQIIHLTPTNQLLANGHLPVWVSLNGHLTKLQHIMQKDVGGFTMYHDYSTRSAVIYFHKRRELDGVISAEYKIKGISVDELNKEYKLGSQSILNVRHYFRKSPQSNDNPKTCEKPKLKVYPELLLTISHDAFQAIEKDSKFRQGVKCISHVLTVYNIVDMLFKFVKSADISINIAGIVIEGATNEWGLASGSGAYIDEATVNDRISEYWYRSGETIRQGSFDYIMYHTRLPIPMYSINIHGVACCEHFEPMRKGSHYYQYNAAIRDFESYEHYSTIAHELTHILGADHDRTFNSFVTHPCDRTVMAAFGCPNLCLKWSDTTEKQLKKFFSSPAHCILRNEPQSLLPDYPRPIFTGLEQCKCYGYETYEDMNHYFANGACSKNMLCKEANNVISFFMYPMDGTPCGNDLNKVCWNKKCVVPQLN